MTDQYETFQELKQSITTATARVTARVTVMGKRYKNGAWCALISPPAVHLLERAGWKRAGDWGGFEMMSPPSGVTTPELGKTIDLEVDVLPDDAALKWAISANYTPRPTGEHREEGIPGALSTNEWGQVVYRIDGTDYERGLPIEEYDGPPEAA